ncbi:DUF1631 family protein [Sedimenticola selenatireducens]|uniref:DUF1631 domain-containing protein n=1 Tax=Sedimenticola selenatireducens TaxID=191960 RepID=A0A558E275_9GAMM|nr:DUF1631 family protein [Sedimenticola selenatireducens]TVO78989.1 DUF1631 domain-containing protein [Sedimenticola selenatireducens]TVT67219.1 MAG: DUF1631 domain-containing protein [Sedimenticola selenatireducens]
MADRELSVIHRYRPLVSSYEKIANSYLEERLAEMFTKVEPVMIDFASKAEADNAQTVFFDAIGQIEGKRDSVTQTFFKSIKAGFNQFLNGGSIVYPKPIIETDDEKQISLVKDSDLELHIAIQAMITKAKNRNHQDLYQLVQRLSVLRQGKKIAGQDVPACPAHIATTFQIAALDYELEQKLLLILYVLFEKNVLVDIGQLYKQANSLLSEAGIYPHLAPVIDIHTRDSIKPTKALPDTEDTIAKKVPNESKTCRTEPLKNEDFELGEEVFRSILTLLTERRRSDPRFKNHPEYLPDGNLEQLRSKPELVSALHEVETPKNIDLQIVSADAFSYLQPEERKTAVITSLQNRITSEREDIYQKLDTNTIPTADLDTIELVGMLFEHILDDDDLASLTKALICHLHTPYLKLAVIDQTFLTDADHIARKLLNLLVNAGRRWVDENNLNAGIYNSMHKLIQALMSEFKGDFSIFEHHYAEFLDDLRALEHKTKLLEERTKEATRGRDRLEFSRVHANEVLSEQCAEIEFHPVLNRFLFSLWKNYMTLLLLRNPEIKGGKEWRSVMMVINSIIKANNALTDLETRQWLKHTLPSLKRHIEEGVEFIGSGGEPSEYTQLKVLFDEWLTSDIKEVANVHPEKAVPPTGPVVKKPATKKKKTRAPSAKQKAVLETVQQTKIGSWFEFDEPDGKLQRVKLSWYSPVTNNHMFIDRFGNKAFILPTEVLVTRLSNNTARIVDPNRFPFVDQTLKKIYSMLRT